MSENELPMTNSTLADQSDWSLIHTSKPDVASENHLQSLGLDINNGLPKFRLNEPGPTALANSIFQQNNMVNDDSEQSFVVLGKSSLESIREASMASYMELQEKCASTDYTASISMMSPSEIEENLKKVLQENIKLKETLKQNNHAMKDQFNTITMWQKEVMTVCDTHKQKFLETKELMNQLKKQNTELRQALAGNQSHIISGNKDNVISIDDCNIPSSLKIHNKGSAENLEQQDTSEINHEHTYVKKFNVMSIDDCDVPLRYSLLEINNKKSAEDLKQQDTPEINYGHTARDDADVLSLLKKSNYVSIENIPSLPDFNESHITTNLKQSYEAVSENEKELQKKLNTVSEELIQLKIKHSETKKLLGDLKDRSHVDIQVLNKQLKKANEELSAAQQKSDRMDSSELQILVSKCCEKDMELKYLNEIITSLKQQLIKYEENILLPADTPTESSGKTSENQSLLMENIDFYNLKLTELRKSFASQSSQHLRIQQFLKECVEIIKIFENAKIISNKDYNEDKIRELKERLCTYRKHLIDEQLHSIDNKQITIETQKHFQKILSDYNSVLCELEIVKNDNLKLRTMQEKASEENSMKLAEIEKYLAEEKKHLDGEKAKLLEERLNLHMEKKIHMEDKEKIETERASLMLEKERLAEDRTSLREEKTSLDQQSKLYEAEESSLQKEKKCLQKKVEVLIGQCENSNKDLCRALEALNTLRAENCRLKENEEMLSAFRIQTDMREREFEEMRLAQRNLQDQLQSLSLANVQLRTEIERLSGQTNGHQNQPSAPAESRYCSLCAKYIVPGERHGVGVCSIEFD